MTKRTRFFDWLGILAALGLIVLHSWLRFRANVLHEPQMKSALWWVNVLLMGLVLVALIRRSHEIGWKELPRWRLFLKILQLAGGALVVAGAIWSYFPLMFGGLALIVLIRLPSFLFRLQEVFFQAFSYFKKSVREISRSLPE